MGFAKQFEDNFGWGGGSDLNTGKVDSARCRRMSDDHDESYHTEFVAVTLYG